MSLTSSKHVLAYELALFELIANPNSLNGGPCIVRLWLLTRPLPPAHPLYTPLVILRGCEKTCQERQLADSYKTLAKKLFQLHSTVYLAQLSTIIDYKRGAQRPTRPLFITMVQSSIIKPQWFRFSKIKSHIQCMAHMQEFNLYNYLLEESYQNGYLILPYHLSAFRLCALTWYNFDPNIFVLRYLAISLAIHHSQFRGADL